MPLDSAISDLHKAHTAAQEKYTYFLLAAAGAAIGFAVQKTEDLPLSWWLLPVAGATLLWAASFFFGCKSVEWVNTSVSANYALLQLRAGKHPNQPPHPELAAAAEAGVRLAIEKNASTAQFYSKWQLRLLVSGAALFIAWRVLEMWRLTH